MGAANRSPTITHTGTSYGTVIQEFSVRAIDWRTRLLALAGIASLVGLCLVPLWWTPVVWVVPAAIVPMAALLLATLSVVPSLFMKTGHIREYLAIGDDERLWLIRDGTSTRVAVPIDERVEVTRFHMMKTPENDRNATWFVAHPSTRRRQRRNQGEPGLRIHGLAGRTMEAALRRALPGLTVIHRTHPSSGD